MRNYTTTLIAGASALMVMLVMITGCTARQEVSREESVSLHEQRGVILTILIDLSGSFEHQMIEGGKGWAMVQEVLSSYFRQRIGEKDQVLIAQISGADRALLWQGTPLQLRQDFASPQAFSSFLRSKAIPTASNVFASTAQAVEYIASDPDVASGYAKSAILVLSDFLDNDPNRDAARERLSKALANYSQKGGAVGCYFVDQGLVAKCREFIAKTGIKNFVVEADFVGHPTLPQID